MTDENVYDYAGENGVLLYQVLKTSRPGGREQVRVRVPDTARDTGWRWTLGDTRRVLYRLPRLRPAIDAGEAVWLAGSEEDVHALEAAGMVAACNPGGPGRWREEYSEVLRDAAVFVVATADKAGRAHARAVAAALDGVAAGVEIREPAEGRTVAEHLAAGRTLAELAVTSDTGEAEPQVAVDLLAFVSQKDPPECWVLKDLLERGDRLIWTAHPGLGKTTAVRQITAAAAAGVHPFGLYAVPPQRVLFLDCENRVRRSRRRFRDLVATCAALGFPVQPGMFKIIHRPDGINVANPEEAEFVLEQVRAHRPDLIGIGPLYKLHEVDINEQLAARQVVRVLDAAVEVCESALIVEAHTPHGDLLRPEGSGVFTRWPDFGYGMRRADPGEKRRVLVQAWRGPRDENAWPRRLMWGDGPGEFPWVVPEGGDAEQEMAGNGRRHWSPSAALERFR